jgi:hypothetical protein
MIRLTKKNFDTLVNNGDRVAYHNDTEPGMTGLVICDDRYPSHWCVLGIDLIYLIDLYEVYLFERTSQ